LYFNLFPKFEFLASTLIAGVVQSVYRLVTTWKIEVRGVRFSSPPRPDLLWGSPSLLSNGYRWGGGYL